MTTIKQSKNIKLCQVVKNIDWLTNHTSVDIFDPVNFTGYQRSIDKNHVSRIVKYISDDFVMPSSIICALDGKYSENSRLRIVDGQHRIEAFKRLKNENIEKYNEIKDNQISVIVIEESNQNVEIDTFITINKTSKKVDTSLAFVLKNKLNRMSTSDQLDISKREYLAVEVAFELNYERYNSIWNSSISFEGNPKENLQFLSLNAFVKSTRTLLLYLEKKGILNINWKSESEIRELVVTASDIIEYIWNCVRNKWKEQFAGDNNQRSIIQGAIGYNAINKSIISELNERNGDIVLDDFYKIVCDMIKSFNISSDYWKPQGIFSKYSSESGYLIVASELKNSKMSI